MFFLFGRPIATVTATVVKWLPSLDQPTITFIPFDPSVDRSGTLCSTTSDHLVLSLQSPSMLELYIHSL